MGYEASIKNALVRLILRLNCRWQAKTWAQAGAAAAWTNVCGLAGVQQAQRLMHTTERAISTTASCIMMQVIKEQLVL